MQPFRLSNLVVLAALVCTGAAIKCYVGSGTDYTPVECSGSCSRITVIQEGEETVTTLSCHPKRKHESCSNITLGDDGKTKTNETLICNSDLCNNISYDSMADSTSSSPPQTASPTTASPSASPTTASLSSSLTSLTSLLPIALLFSFVMPHVF